MKGLKLKIKELSKYEVFAMYEETEFHVEVPNDEVEIKNVFNDWVQLNFVAYNEFTKEINTINIICADRDIAAYILRWLKYEVSWSKLMWINDSKLSQMLENTNYEEIINSDIKAVYVWDNSYNARCHLFR